MSDDSPLDVLLKVMRARMAENEYDAAVAVAKLAAPYLHGRAPTVRPPGDLAGVPDDELGRWESGCGEAAEDEDPEEPE